MATLTQLRLDKSKQPATRITVQGSGAVPHCFRGNAAVYRIAVFLPDGSVADLGDHASLNLAYMPTSRAEDAVAVATSAIEDAVFTEEEWAAGTRYHAEFAFSEGDMNPVLSGITQSFWLVCYGILTGSGHEVTHGGSSIAIEEDGTQNTVTPPDPPEVGVTAAQVTAQIAAELSELDAIANPMEAAGDLIVGGEAGEPERIPVGTEGQILTVGAEGPAWDDAPEAGMANPMEAAGDLIVGGEASEPGRIPVGTEGQILTVGPEGPAWADAPDGGAMTDPMEAVGDMIVAGESGPERLAIGAEGQILTVGETGPEWADAPESAGAGGLRLMERELEGADYLGGGSNIHLFVACEHIVIERVEAEVAVFGDAPVTVVAAVNGTPSGAVVSTGGVSTGSDRRFGSATGSWAVSVGGRVSLNWDDGGGGGSMAPNLATGPLLYRLFYRPNPA